MRRAKGTAMLPREQETIAAGRVRVVGGGAAAGASQTSWVWFTENTHCWNEGNRWFYVTGLHRYITVFGRIIPEGSVKCIRGEVGVEGYLVSICKSQWQS